MKRSLLLLVWIAMLAPGAMAQSPYVISSRTEAYAPLTGASSVNNGAVWASQIFSVPLPFTAKIGSTNVNRFFTDGSSMYADTTGASVDLFQCYYTYCVDRGMGQATSRSPLRYATTGNTGSRIFKYEVAGAGYFAEIDSFHTANDSFSCQFWIYEGSNVIEIHFGPAKISHPNMYFGSPAVPTATTPGFTGYFNINLSAGMPNYGYFATGDPSNVHIDSLRLPHNPEPFTTYPPAGSVMRFTPAVTTGVNLTEKTLPVTVYPTLCSDILHVELQNEGAVQYTVLSLNGMQALISGQADTSQLHSINVATLAPGMYLLQVESAGRKAISRFIKTNE